MPSSSQQRLVSQFSSVEDGDEHPRRKVRFNLEVAHSVAEQMGDLQRKSHSHTKTEVIRKALALLHLFLEQKEAGTSIVFRRKDGSEEVLKLLF
jgi:hypothetical protein